MSDETDWPTCEVPVDDEGTPCGKRGRSRRARICPMHYHRRYRHGDVNKVSDGITVSLGRRYRTAYRPGHPLARTDGRGFNGYGWAHRFELYDKIGPGPHECHWCKTEIDWLPKGDPSAIQVDHLNGLGDDNRWENIVPACGPCNTGRGSQRRHDALVALGYWSANDTVEQGRTQRRRARVEPPSA